MRGPKIRQEAPTARMGKRGRLLVIAGVLAGILALLGLMDRVQTGHERDADRRAAAAEQELRLAVQRFADAVHAGTAMFNRLEADNMLGPVSFTVNGSTGQLTANRTVSSGAAKRCVTVHYARTVGTIETEVNHGLCPPLVG